MDERLINVGVESDAGTVELVLGVPVVVGANHRRLGHSGFKTNAAICFSATGRLYASTVLTNYGSALVLMTVSPTARMDPAYYLLQHVPGVIFKLYGIDFHYTQVHMTATVAGIQNCHVAVQMTCTGAIDLEFVGIFSLEDLVRFRGNTEFALRNWLTIDHGAFYENQRLGHETSRVSVGNSGELFYFTPDRDGGKNYSAIFCSKDGTMFSLRNELDEIYGAVGLLDVALCGGYLVVVDVRGNCKTYSLIPKHPGVQLPRFAMPALLTMEHVDEIRLVPAFGDGYTHLEACIPAFREGRDYFVGETIGVASHPATSPGRDGNDVGGHSDAQPTLASPANANSPTGLLSRVDVPKPPVTTIVDVLFSATYIGPCMFCSINSGILTCSRCKKVRYCSKECQMLAWSDHSRVCAGR